MDPHPAFPLCLPLGADLQPLDAFLRLWNKPYCLFLDGSAATSPLRRYSFVTADPFHVVSAAPDQGLSALQEIKSWLRAHTSAGNPHLPPFQGGVAGLFGYELGTVFEELPRAAFDEFQIPALLCGWYDVVVAFDHQRGAAWIVSQGYPETADEARRRRAASRLAEFRGWLEGAAPQLPLGATIPAPAGIAAPQHLVHAPLRIFSNFTAAEYREKVQTAIGHIHAGDVFQINLSQRLLTPQRDHAVPFYLRLRERTPAPFSAYFDARQFQISSASPERFVQVRGRMVETRPIKGTRRQTLQPEADLYAADELQANVKDRAENVMIVDLLRNDLSRVCLPDSIHVPQLCALERHGYVQHLVSCVEGQLRPSEDAISLLQAAFPGGSVTGAPKIRAMELITQLEGVARGAYCGCLGYLSCQGDADLNILIRTVTHVAGWCHLPVGGGIVAQSQPRAEHEETWHKAAGMLAALA